MNVVDREQGQLLPLTKSIEFTSAPRGLLADLKSRFTFLVALVTASLVVPPVIPNTSLAQDASCDLDSVMRNTESMDEKERRDWKQRRIPYMSREQLDELCEILLKEKRELERIDREYAAKKPNKPPQSTNSNEYFDAFKKAFEAKDDRRIVETFEELLGKFKSNGNVPADPFVYEIAATAAENTGQREKLKKICDMGISERADSPDRNRFFEMLDTCVSLLVRRDGALAFGYIMAKYHLKTGSKDKETLLSQIALNESDAILTVQALMSQNRVQEAHDLIEFFGDRNPQILATVFGPFLPPDRPRRHEVNDRNWQNKIERILKYVVLPAVLIGGAIYNANRQEKLSTERERRKEENAERQRQIQHDQENTRRRAQGLPTIEEEERQNYENAERNRDQRIQRCFDQCQTAFHKCLAGSNEECCRPSGCVFDYCPTKCDRAISECRGNCN